MYNENISINVKGTTDAKFTSVTYQASVNTTGATGPEAKRKAEAAITALKRLVRDHAKAGALDTERLRTSFAVDTYNNRNSGEFAGYKATYSLKFKGKNVVYATQLHDMLTSIVGVESPSPQFNIDDTTDLHDIAFADAVAKGEKRFKAQCAALKLDPNAFKLVNWSIREEEPRGKFLAIYSPQFSTDSLELPNEGTPNVEPGKASYDINVAFNYVRN